MRVVNYLVLHLAAQYHSRKSMERRRQMLSQVPSRFNFPSFQLFAS